MDPIQQVPQPFHVRFKTGPVSKKYSLEHQEMDKIKKFTDPKETFMYSAHTFVHQTTLTKNTTTFTNTFYFHMWSTPTSERYKAYPQYKFRLQILPLQRCGHYGAHACRVCWSYWEAWMQFADNQTMFTHCPVCLQCSRKSRSPLHAKCCL
jgi:hypothetical protein